MAFLHCRSALGRISVHSSSHGHHQPTHCTTDSCASFFSCRSYNIRSLFFSFAFNGRIACRPGRLAGWLAGWMTGWLVGWLVSWLDGWLSKFALTWCKQKLDPVCFNQMQKVPWSILQLRGSLDTLEKLPAAANKLPVRVNLSLLQKLTENLLFKLRTAQKCRVDTWGKEDSHARTICLTNRTPH